MNQDYIQAADWSIIEKGFDADRVNLQKAFLV